MKAIPIVIAAAAALGVPGLAAAGANPSPQQFCQVQFESGGSLYSGVGTTVTTASGNSLSVCRVSVPPPPETVVTTFPAANGDVVVVTRAGTAVVVFH